MKKPIIPIIAIAVIIIGIVAFSFADFETSVDIPKTSDTGEAGDNISSDGTLVTVVEVTDKTGEVVATEKVTFSQDDVKFGQDFFAKPNEETTLPTGIAPDRLQALTTTPDNSNTQTTMVNYLFQIQIKPPLIINPQHRQQLLRVTNLQHHLLSPTRSLQSLI